jgi:hypothetical protein
MVMRPLVFLSVVALVVSSSPPSPEEEAAAMDSKPTSQSSDLEAAAPSPPTEQAAKEESPRDVFTGRPIDGAPRFEKQAATKGDRASMQWIVTKTMQRELRTLGYTRPEIEAISPDRAVEVIKLKIRRPTRGMPRRWRKDCVGSPFGAALACARDLFSRTLGTVAPAVVYLALTAAGVSLVATQSMGRQQRSPRAASAFASPSDVFVPQPDRLWLDVQIDRMEWWMKNRRRSSPKK